MTTFAPDIAEWIARVRVDDAVFDLQPSYCAGLMVVAGLPSGPSDADSEGALLRAEQQMSNDGEGFGDAQVEAWREAFRSFGAKPKRTRPSVDALRRRAGKAGLPRINRVTDLYNAISVAHGVPIGVEDIDRYVGALRLVRATGDERFVTTDHGEPIEEVVETGEPIWRDDAGATCRRWNWRQTTRTALDETTANAVFIVDVLGEGAVDIATTVLGELRATIAPAAPAVTRTITASG